jgi:putative tributyrin esterase
MARFTCNFISYTLLRAVDITVIVPSITIPEAMGFEGSPFRMNMQKAAGLEDGVFLRDASWGRHSKAEKYPVLYLLHGYGNNHATWTGYTNLELYAEERNIAVVMLSAENKSYVNHGTIDRFFEFIEQELPDFILGMFPISRRPEDTFIAGLSMGGFGALIHGLTHPEKYAAIGAFSAAVSLNTSLMAGYDDHDTQFAYDPSSLAKKLAADGKHFPKLYIACGEKDPLYGANAGFVKELVSMNANPAWVTHPAYGHEWRFWDMQAEQFLDWIPRSDTYAKAGKRQI